VKTKEDREKFKSIIKDLLEHDADPEVMNSKEKQPLDLACGSEEIKEIFFTSNQFCLRHVKNKITDFYRSNDREIKRGFWIDAPPLKIEQCFINLSIVEEEVQKSKEKETLRNKRNREQIFGGYADVFKTANKELILPKDLFESRGGKNPKRLLIFGRAGIGKSTLCQYLAYQWWGKDAVWKNRFDLVVKINLRNLTKERYSDKNVSLARIIVREYFQSTNEEEKEIQYIEKALASIPGRQKLFLLDGYDEFPMDSPCKTTINTLLSPQNDSYLVVTSRPYANISADFDLHLECVGFISEDIPRYLNLPGVCKNTDAAERILAFLNQNPAIHGLAHSPIFLDLLTLSSKRMFVSESAIITKLYKHLVNKIWERYYLKQLGLNLSQKDVVERQKQAEKFLRALAFHSLLEEGVVFSFGSVEQVAINACGWEDTQIAAQIESLMAPGFLNCYRGKTLTDNEYSFPHLTIQEYLAAFYITDWLSADTEMQAYNENILNREKITAEKFILKNKNHSHFQGVWDFMSEIIADSKPQHIKDLFNRLLQDPKDTYVAERAAVLAAVQKNWRALRCASEKFKNDKEIVRAAVRQDGTALEYASKELKNNRKIVLEAIKRSWPALEYASETLKNDEGVVLAAVQQFWRALQHASEPLKNHKGIALEAVKQNARALKYLSESLKNDIEVVLVAVKQSEVAFEYVSESLKNDREIVLAAVQQSCMVLKYASEALKSDKEFMLAAVQQSWQALEYASEALKNDREIVLAAVQKSGRAFEYASEALKNDREIVLAAVQQSWMALKYASEALKSDREIVLAAVQQSWMALEYASEELKNDREIVLAAVQQSWMALKYASEA
ncbi:MAG: NACHT domain-containing protein, partial [Parachlamydiaceae bacterium]